MFSNLVAEGRFREAEALLIAEIRRAELVDPADDFSWGVAADALAYPILEREGPSAFRDYHQRLLDLFVGELEPRYGHLHKGHLYYRLASGALADDFEAGLDHFRAAIAEDELKARAGAPAGADPGRVVTAASLALLALERVARTGRREDRWSAFQAGLPWLRFEVAMESMTADPARLRAALDALVGPGAGQVLADRRQELATAAALGLGASIPVLLAAYVRSIVRCRLHRQGVDIGDASLRAVLDAAAGHAAFPAPVVESTFRLAALWHSALDEQPCPDEMPSASDEAERLVSTTAAVLVDRAVLAWADAA